MICSADTFGTNHIMMRQLPQLPEEVTFHAPPSEVNGKTI